MNDDDAIESIDDTWDVIVVGAGIAGLVAGVTAADAGHRVLVLDAHQPGGRARTVERDGYLHNIGPHALYRAGHLHRMLRRHGVELPGGQPDLSRVRMLRDGALTPITFRARDIATTPLLGFRDRIRVLALLAKLPKIRTADLVGRSVADWLADTPAPVAQFVEMLVRTSTYVNGPELLDAGAAVDQVQLGLRGVDYLDGGWERIVAALTTLFEARGGTIETGATVAAVEADGMEVQVRLPSGTLSATSVVVAAGGPDVVERLTGARPAGVDHLTAPAEAASLDLALDRPHPGVVFGLDTPHYLSSHAPAARLAPEGRGLVSVLRYLGPGVAAGDVDSSRSELRALAALSGIADGDVVHERYLHRNVVTYGAPAAAGGGMAGRPSIDSIGVPGLFVAGDWVGPAGMIGDASAASGESAAIAAIRHCASVPA